MPGKKPSIKTGDIIESKNSGLYEVIDYVNGNEIYVEFIKTGFVCKTSVRDIKQGYVRDKLRPNICGVGYYGDSDENIKEHKLYKQCYQTWYNMMRRCYDKTNPRFDRYGGRGVVVGEDWHNFQNFFKWYVENYKEDCVIDKDILERGNKTYCAEKCRFVPKRINCLFGVKTKTNGNLPMGVKKKMNALYPVQVCNSGSPKTIGYFKTIDEASEAYKMTKKNIIVQVANEEYQKGVLDDDVYYSLLNWDVSWEES